MISRGDPTEVFSVLFWKPPLQFIQPPVEWIRINFRYLKRLKWGETLVKIRSNYDQYYCFRKQIFLYEAALCWTAGDQSVYSVITVADHSVADHSVITVAYHSVITVADHSVITVACHSQSVQPLDSTSSGFSTASRSAEGEAREYYGVPRNFCNLEALKHHFQHSQINISVKKGSVNWSSFHAYFHAWYLPLVRNYGRLLSPLFYGTERNGAERNCHHIILRNGTELTLSSLERI